MSKQNTYLFAFLLFISACGGGGGGGDAPFQLTANNTSISTNEDTPRSGRVSASANKTTEISYSFLSQPTNGKLETMSDGAFTYSPNENFFGSDSFTFSATSTEYNSTVTGTITITITAADDLPILRTKEYFIDENQTLVGALDIFDAEGDSFTISIVDERANIFKPTLQLGNEDGSPYVIDQDYTVTSDQVVELISDLQIKAGAIFTLEPGAKLIAKDTYENGDYKWCDRNVTSDGDKNYEVTATLTNIKINGQSCYFWNLKHIHLYEGNFIAEGVLSEKVFIRNVAFLLAREGGFEGFSWSARREDVERIITFDYVDMAGGFIIPYGYPGSLNNTPVNWFGYENKHLYIKNSYFYKTNNLKYFTAPSSSLGDFVFENNQYVGNGGFIFDFFSGTASNLRAGRGDEYAFYFSFQNNLIVADDNMYWASNYIPVEKGRLFINSVSGQQASNLGIDQFDFPRFRDTQGNQIFIFENNTLTRFLDDVPGIHCNQKNIESEFWILPPIGANYFGYDTINDFWDSSQNIQNLEKCKLYDSEQYFLSKSPQEFSYTPRIYLAKDLNPASDSDEKKIYFDFPVDYEALKNKSFEYKVNITLDSNSSGTPDVTESFLITINNSD
jgi:hypothetical protein